MKADLDPDFVIVLICVVLVLLNLEKNPLLMWFFLGAVAYVSIRYVDAP